MCICMYVRVYIRIYFFVGRDTPVSWIFLLTKAEGVCPLWKENIWNWSSQCINVAALSFVRCSAKLVVFKVITWNRGMKPGLLLNAQWCFFSPFFPNINIFIQWRMRKWERASWHELGYIAPLRVRVCMSACTRALRLRKESVYVQDNVYVDNYTTLAHITRIISSFGRVEPNLPS